MSGAILTAISLVPAFLSAFALFGFRLQTALYTALYAAFALLAGEYVLPLLIQLDAERYDFAQRISSALPGICGGDGTPSGVRVRVLDEDAPVMTWIGFRTVLVARGCYNLSPGDFGCALREAYGQRRNLRSLMLLAATVGNPVYLACRLFCRIGRLFTRLIGILIGVILSLRRPLIGGTVGAHIGDGIYRFLSALFLMVSHIAVYVPYWPLFVIADLGNDRALAGRNLGGALRRLIEERRMNGYTGFFLREYSMIMRPPAAWRLRAIEAANAAPALSDRPASQAANAPSARPAAVTARRGGLNVPSGMRVSAPLPPPPADTPRTEPAPRSSGRIVIKGVTRGGHD